MPQQLINIGTNANDGTGDSLRTAGSKINSNFSELYAKPVYTLPTASQSVLGGVKVGNTLQINPATSLLNLNATLNDLTDTQIQSPSVNQILKYNGAQWVNASFPPEILQLDNVTDVTITTATAGQFLKYNGSQWINSELPSTPTQLVSLTDVTINTPNNGEFLKYNGTRWVNSTLPTTSVQLDNLTDVTVSAPNNGEFLKYNGSQWVNSTLPTTSVQLDNLTDVTITTPFGGQVLYYNGSQWVNTILATPAIQIDNLTDVTITAPTSGQVLKYNGTQWVNGIDAGQAGNAFNQNLNTTNDVQFNTTKSKEYILDGSGTPTLESATNINLSANGKIKIITRSPLTMATMTTVQRDSLVGVENGDVIYNTSTNKFQGRAAGSWVDLH